MIDSDKAIQIATQFLAGRRAGEVPSVQEVTTKDVETLDGKRRCHVVSFGWPIRVAVDEETGNANMLR